MKEYVFPLSTGVGQHQKTLEDVTIVQYNSDVASVKNRIRLEQNLFSFLLEGEKTVQYADGHIKIRPHQFLLLSSGNCLMSENIASEAGHYRSILLFFDTKVLTDFFVKRPWITAAPLIHLDTFLLFEKDAFLINFIDSLSHILREGPALSQCIQNVKMEELLLYLYDKYPTHMQKLRTLGQNLENELIIRQAVTANLENPVSVEELAFLCNVSLSTFKRRFAKIYGTSPNRWLLDKRMQKAARLLKQGNYKPSEIFIELGYDNLSSFVQSFKQVHGITPKQYQLTN